VLSLLQNFTVRNTNSENVKKQKVYSVVVSEKEYTHYLKTKIIKENLTIIGRFECC
jgi:hypothetical protein